MNDVDPRAALLQFPEASRLRRGRTFDIAAKAIPLLQAALDSGNATLLRELFAVLGDVADGGDAHGRISAISMENAEVVAMPTRRAGS